VRFNDINASTPSRCSPPVLRPERRLPAMNHIPHYQNLNPGFGFAYDLFRQRQDGAQGVARSVSGDHQGRDRQSRRTTFRGRRERARGQTAYRNYSLIAIC
jgi:hypothetical protein